MKKHAYLIMAHNNLYNLKKLLCLLDYEDNDIYVHIDRKNKRFPFESIQGIVKNARLRVYSDFDTNWGGFSLVQCEIFLLEQAFANGGYQYYHLLSGADLPIKTHSEINKYFENNEGYEFVQFADKKLKEDKKIMRRVKLYHFIQEYRKRSKNKVVQECLTYLSKGMLVVQMILRVDRMRKSEFELKYGSQWFSITEAFVEYFLSQKKFIYKTFRYTMCPDELVVQTVLFNSSFKERIYQYVKMGEEQGNLREINWDRNTDLAHPYIWSENDMEYLMKSKMLFARKFDEQISKQVIDDIYAAVKE